MAKSKYLRDRKASIALLGLIIGAACVGGFVLWRHKTKAAAVMFTLPGWEDVELHGQVPKDIEWTCHRKQPDQPDDCKGQRDVPIEQILVVRRPDLGVIAISSINIDASMVELLRKRWGTPTRERRTNERIDMVWCSADLKSAAAIDFLTGKGETKNPFGTAEITAWPVLGDECKQLQAEESKRVGSNEQTADETAKADNRNSERTTPTFTSEARCTPENDYAARCNFELHGTAFEIDQAGHGTQTTNGKTIKFNLPIADGDHLGSVQYVEYAHDAILIFQAGNIEVLGSSIMRVSIGASKAVWTAKLGGFNVGDGVVEGSRLYETTIGMAACMDLDTGRFVWRREDIGFNSFERPELSANDVTLRESHGKRSMLVRKADGATVSSTPSR